MYFATIPLLRAQNPVPLNTEFLVGGHTNAGDGGEGTFIWIPSVPSTAPRPFPDDDGITLWSTLDTSGYFKRVFSGPINVRWFGATGNGTTDDTNAVLAARNSIDFANNGTLYFPKGKYMGAFVFEYRDSDHNEINIIGDGHGSILCSNGTTDMMTLQHNPVVVLGYHKGPDPLYPIGWLWARISNLAIIGAFGSQLYFSDGIHLVNPSTGEHGSGCWVFERILFSHCGAGVVKEFGSIGNHFIDCTWDSNDIGVHAIGVPGMHCGSDKYTGGHFSWNHIAGLHYDGGVGGVMHLIVDGAYFEQNNRDAPNFWAIWIKASTKQAMLWSAICLRNLYFEKNGEEGGTGGDMRFEALRSVRIDDCGFGKMHLIESSVNLYNCSMNSNEGNAPNDDSVSVDEKSSLVAYEHRYSSYPTSHIFVNSISYDGSWDIAGEGWQSTSVWGPLRCITTSKRNSVLTHQFDSVSEAFNLNPPGPGTTNTVVWPMHVLGTGSGKLTVNAGDHIVSHTAVGIIPSAPKPKYLVWSIHTYLLSPVPNGHQLDELFGEIKDGGINLGCVYFKYDQWACSYGMKLVDVTHGLNLELHFYSGSSTFGWPGYNADFLITDYQIVQFDDLYSANSYVNSREFSDMQGG